MKHKLEQSPDSFIKSTLLTQAIENYNSILDKVNKCKIYKKPEPTSSNNYQIADDMQIVFDSLEKERIYSLNIIRDLLDQGEDPNVPEETIEYVDRRDGLYWKSSIKRSPLYLAKDNKI
jgi:hypothetical protein